MKPNIKKLIKIAAAAFSGLMLVSSAAAFADDGAEFELYYDFEDYNAAPMSGVLPDNEYWGLSSSTSYYATNFGSYTEDGNTAMKILPWAEPVLFFNRIAESGRLHISFDFKTSNPIFDTLVLFDDGVTSQDPRYSGHKDLKYSRGPRFMTASGTVSYNAYSATSTDPGGLSSAWNYVPSDVTFDGREWHRFDMITTDLSKADARVTYYLDGQKININPVYCAKALGLKSVFILPNLEKDADGNSPAWTNNDFFIIDNMTARRYFDETGLRGTAEGDGKVDLSNGELTVRLSERVDKSTLTADNMTIKGGTNNKTLSNFTVEPISNVVSDAIDSNTTDEFKVKFSGDIDMGSYTLTLSDSVVGKSFGLSMVTPVEFRTKPKVKRISMQYINDDFNDYTSDSDLPNGWSYLPSIENVFHKSSSGKSGESGDNAIGIENAEIKADQTRIIKRFSAAATGGVEYKTTFDVYAENMYWYLYLLENGDFDENNAGFDENVAIAAKSGGQISYAKNRTKKAREMTDISGLKVNKGKWNRVELTVAFENGKTVYKIKVNDSDEYTVETNRDFASAATEGIGFGYYPTDETSKLYIDNVSVTSDTEAIYPEVDKFEFIDSTDTAVPSDSGVTSTLKSVKVYFNTLVDAEAARDRITVSSNDSTEYRVDVYDDGNESVAEVVFPRLLNPEQEYTVSVSEGITSRYSADVSSLIGTSRRFSTVNDACFKTIKNAVEKQSDGTYVYTLKVIKNTDDSLKFTALISATESKIDGEKTFDRLIGAKYIPIDIQSGDRGIFEYSVPVEFAGDGVTVTPMLWSWPNNVKINL